MTVLRQWALRVCVCCVLAGLLQLLLPQKGCAKVIKTVLALYILVSVLTPGQQVGWAEIREQLEAPLQPVSFTDAAGASALVQQAALNALSARLTAALAGQGVEARIAIEPAPDAGGEESAHLQVTALLQNPEQADRAQAILQEELNGTGSILCRGMEGAP